MKQQIDNLIANTLLNEGGVYLPGKGSLILRRHAAARLSSKKVQPPYRELEFTTEECGVSLITLISKTANVSEERASDIFTEWLSKSSRVQSPTRRSLIISGVCTIATFEVESRSTNNSYRGEKSEITTDQKFEDMVNPKGRKAKSVAPRPKYFIYIMAGLCVGVALGVCGTHFYVNGTFDELLSKQNLIPTSKQLIAHSEEVSPIAGHEVEPIVKPTIEPIEVVNEALATDVNAENNTEASTEPAAQTEQIVDIAEKPAEVVEQPAEPVVEPTPEPAVEKPAEPVAQKPAKLEIKYTKKGYSYAVWGIFRDLENTKKAIARLAEEHPTIECKLYHYGAQHLLTIYEAPSRTECNDKVSAWQKKYKSFHKVWVHTQK